MAARSSDWMSPEVCLAMRIPDLGVAILRRLRALGPEWSNPHNFVQWTVDGNDGWFSPIAPISTSVYTPADDRRQRRDELKTKLRQAWNWVEQQGYVAPAHGQHGGNWKVITDEGWRIAHSREGDDTLRRVQAAAQLTIDLHPRLQEAGVEATFRAGDTDSAIRDAFADLEDTVRTLSGYSTAEYGVRMMSKAFAKTGPLGSVLDHHYQVGIQRMFEGAFAILRNPAGHGATNLGVEEALESVLHADLLMRHLDRVKQRKAAEL